MDRALGEHARLEISPQRDEQFSSKRDDANASHALADAETRSIPDTQGTRGLIAEPSPLRELHHGPAEVAIPGAGDALIVCCLPALVRRGRETGQGAQLSAVSNLSPGKDLRGQHPRTDRADGSQRLELLRRDAPWSSCHTLLVVAGLLKKRNSSGSPSLLHSLFRKVSTEPDHAQSRAWMRIAGVNLLGRRGSPCRTMAQPEQGVRDEQCRLLRGRPLERGLMWFQQPGACCMAVKYCRVG
jgi:hypothetical protein